MRHLLIILCLLVVPLLSKGQDKETTRAFFLSIEPNMMLANRTFSDYQANKTLYLKNKNSAGVGINFGYQLERNNLFVNAQIHFLLLRNAVAIDFENSGFNATSDIKYSDDSYGFDYVTAEGLNINGGYKIATGRKNCVYLGIGAHMDYTFITSSSNGVQVTTSSSGTGTFQNVYYEEMQNYPKLSVGGDAFANYNFHLGKASMIVGAHYSFVPGQTIKAHFKSFQSISAANSGTVTLHRSYAGLTLGVFLGKTVRKAKATGKR